MFDEPGSGRSPHIYGLVNGSVALSLSKKNALTIRRHIPANKPVGFFFISFMLALFWRVGTYK
jgi:hypothetical protein